MLDDALDKLREWALPVVMQVGNTTRLMAPPAWMDLTPKRPSPAPLEVGTLTGLVAYVHSVVNDNALDNIGPFAIHVKAPDQVLVIGRLADEDEGYARHVYCRASLDLVGGPLIPMGQYMEAESMVIGLAAGCEATDDGLELSRLLASIRESTVRETLDSGVSQEVKTGRGVAMMGTTTVRNPWSLRPHRTFREIQQPESRFVVRLKSRDGADKPLVALFEAEGNAWKLLAIETIKAWLNSHPVMEGIPLIA